MLETARMMSAPDERVLDVLALSVSDFKF